MTLSSVVDNLYGLPLDEFVATRNERATGLLAGGVKELSAQVRALPKPSAGAWGINMLARRDVDLLEEVIDLGVQMRDAQRRSDGPRLRALDAERRHLMSRVTAGADSIAQELRQKWSAAAASGVEESMRAAMNDPDAADAVTSGMLVTTLTATGFSTVDLTGALALPEVSGSRRARARQRLRSVPTGSSSPARRPRVGATKAVAEAKKEADHAGQLVRATRKDLTKAEIRRARLQDRLESLTQELDGVRTELAAADDAARGLARDLANGERELSAARRALTNAQARLDRAH